MADIYSKNFQEARLRVLERDGYRCRTCDHDGSIYRLDVHHRHYRDGANPKDEDLITLCVACHDLITNKMRGDRYSRKELTLEDSECKIAVNVSVFVKTESDTDLTEVQEIFNKPTFNTRTKNV
jgi:hypothetical protein